MTIKTASIDDCIEIDGLVFTFKGNQYRVVKDLHNDKRTKIHNTFSGRQSKPPKRIMVEVDDANALKIAKNLLEEYNLIMERAMIIQSLIAKLT